MSGHLHPITILTNQVIEYFDQFGFSVLTGNELQSEYNNFDALNVPKDHPARDEHDTFYTSDGLVLRTHTTSLYVDAVKALSESEKKSIRMIFPGRTYRNEATDATHDHTFSQLDCLVIEEGVTLQHLIGTLRGLMKHLYGDGVEIRLRPSYFPFVEPGFEMDMRLPGSKNWLEILGTGMIHPHVLNALGLDPDIYQGFAFGAGMERLANLITHTPDVRTYYSGDYRFLGQFL